MLLIMKFFSELPLLPLYEKDQIYKYRHSFISATYVISPAM